MMKFAFLILLFTARYTWALEYREIIGEYRCDINEAPYNESNNLEKKPGVWDKYKNMVFRFRKGEKLDLLDSIKKGKLVATYDTTTGDAIGGDLTMNCKSELNDGNSTNFQIKITKFSRYLIFKIDDTPLLFLRTTDFDSEIKDKNLKRLGDSGYLRDGKPMVWWGTGPCGLKNDKGTNGGVLVGCLYEHSPAAISGLQLGDEIISINGIKTLDWDVIREFIKKDAAPGKDFEVKVIRNGKETVFMSFMITLDIDSQTRMGEAGMCRNFKEK